MTKQELDSTREWLTQKKREFCTQPHLPDFVHYERALHALQTMRTALLKVSCIVESTYGHDEYGRRSEDVPPRASGADIVEMLCSLEDEIDKALGS